jgi:DNA-directed RNA polymerase specialized sigma24 family protein
MDKAALKAGLRAYKDIDEEIAYKRLFCEQLTDADEIAACQKQAAETQKAKEQIIKAINHLPTIEKDCIYRHYIKGELWVSISMRHNYQDRQIRQIAYRGLDRLIAEVETCPEAAAFCEKARMGHFD